MWIGLYNYKFGTCTSEATCRQYFQWADGEAATVANSDHVNNVRPPLYYTCFSFLWQLDTSRYSAHP